MEEHPLGDSQNTSFGTYIKSIRIEKGLSIEQVASATRISTDTLMHIETEDMDRMLAPVYVKGFLRSISKYIGADSEKAVALYSDLVDKRADSIKSHHQKGVASFRWGLALGLLFLLCALSAGGYAFFNYLSENPGGWRFWEKASQPAASSEISALNKPEENKPETALKAETQPVAPLTAKSKPLLLDVRATKETWMKVIGDERTPTEYHLKPGDRLALEASSKFNLLIGNVAGVQLTLNGKPYPVFGKAGQTVTVQIP